MSPEDRAEIRLYWHALRKHWIAVVGGAVVSVAQLCYSLRQTDWSPMTTVGILLCGFLAAGFLAWRDEHRKAHRISLRECFDRCIEIIKSGKGIYPIGMLNEVHAYKLQNNGDLEWVCSELKLNDHGHPFARLEAWIKPEDQLDFLRFVHDRAYDIAYSDFAPAIEAWRIRKGYPPPTGPPSFLIERSAGKPPEPPWTDVLVSFTPIESVEVQLTAQNGSLTVIVVNHAKEELRVRRIWIYIKNVDGARTLLANSDTKTLLKSEFVWPCVFAPGERKEFITRAHIINLISQYGNGTDYVAEVELDSKRMVPSKPFGVKVTVAPPPVL